MHLRLALTISALFFTLNAHAKPALVKKGCASKPVFSLRTQEYLGCEIKTRGKTYLKTFFTFSEDECSNFCAATTAARPFRERELHRAAYFKMIKRIIALVPASKIEEKFRPRAMLSSFVMEFQHLTHD